MRSFYEHSFISDDIEEKFLTYNMDGANNSGMLNIINNNYYLLTPDGHFDSY